MLSTIVKQFCEEAGFAENFTNYSDKVTCATSLFQSRIDEQLITRQTGQQSYSASCNHLHRRSHFWRRKRLAAWEASHQRELHTPNPLAKSLHQSVHLTWMREVREWILPPVLERLVYRLFNFHFTKDLVSTSPLTSTRSFELHNCDNAFS